ncbi:MAG: DUF4157 domain-containing protein [Chloroflexota bacterium]
MSTKNRQPPIPALGEALNAPGLPLDSETSAFMEPRFGHDFSRVRVHSDAKAAESAHATGAQAYTIGNHIFSSPEYWSPRTSSGQELIAHELAHTLQQSTTSIASGSGTLPDIASLRVSDPDSLAEAEADHVAQQVVMSRDIPAAPILVTTSRLPRVLQRRTLRRSYATAAFETGPIWDVTLTVTGAPDGNSDDVDYFINACMDGIRSAAESLGRGQSVQGRHMLVRIPYRRRFDYSTISQEAYAAARRSVMPVEQPRQVPPPPQPQPPVVVPPSLPPSAPPKTVIVIGSPSSSQAYGFQFVTAALCHPRDANTIWLVEHSGYEMIYGTHPRFITDQAPMGGYGWISPSQNLAGWINSMPDRSISRLVVYSHGVPGLVALRYGWGAVNLPDYGLNLNDIARLAPSKFTPDATIEFNSCNTGVGAGGQTSLAQNFANRTGRPVQAWTGRTSYAGVNRGTCQVRGSSYSVSTDAISEWWSRRRAGTAPQLRTFSPTEGTTQ